jgi:glycine cleavage system aminomethyltransferase T
MKLAGAELRLDHGDPMGEALACRSTCALFDFSFIRSVRLQGKHARTLAEAFASRSLATLRENKIAYALHVDADGNALSDLTIWQIAPDIIEVMSGRPEDIAALLAHESHDLRVIDLNTERAIYSLQGPDSFAVLHRLGAIGSEALGYFEFGALKIADVPCVIGRLGYTGEAGFEIVVERKHAARLWQSLASLTRPAGFIAADALRIEAGFVLFANELRLPVTPKELGLARFYAGPRLRPSVLKLISFTAEADDLNWPWQPAATLASPAEPGDVVITSACHSSLAEKILGLGYVLTATQNDTPLRDPNGMFRNIAATQTPFYDPQKTRPRAAWSAIPSTS